MLEWLQCGRAQVGEGPLDVMLLSHLCRKLKVALRNRAVLTYNEALGAQALLLVFMRRWLDQPTLEAAKAQAGHDQVSALELEVDEEQFRVDILALRSRLDTTLGPVQA
ncbi:hypothetical protein [Deinococcus kurensis]|uniref:hypothetical protein n=1 Tax=Deinococcus kurensis TaxID=2662757 RepID=UPI0012D369A8|nr:hypothetical protein [Deinococcus kurensis]